MHRFPGKPLLSVALGAVFLLGGLAGCGSPSAAPHPKAKTHTAGKKPGGAKGHPGHKATGGSKGKKSTAASKGGRSGHKGSAGAKTAKGGKGHGKGRAKHHRGAPAAPVSLATLPPLSALTSFNPGLRYTHRLSNFIPGMGFHRGAPGPGLVLMTNRNGLVTAVEASFPQKLGTYPWFDPPTVRPNGGVAFNSEHLYFVPPAEITPGMSPNLPSDLTSWTRFVAVNSRLSAYVRLPMRYKGLSVYGPPSGPGILVLVSPATSGAAGRAQSAGSTTGTTTPKSAAAPSGGQVTGFAVEEPASWGWFPWYAQPKGKPTPSKLYGRAYWSVLFLTPPSHP